MSRARILRRLYDDYGAPIVDDIAEALGDLFEVKPRPKPRQKPDIRYDNPSPERQARKQREAQENSRPSELMRDPNFARWFEGSKAVDKYGEPLMLTHGTLSGQINEFRPNTHFGTPIQANTRIEALQEAKDLPLSFLKFAARKLLGSDDVPTNIPVYLSVRNPKRMNDHLGESWEDRVRVARDEGFDSIVYLNRAELSDDAHEAILKEELRSGFSLNDDEIRAVAPEVADSYIVFDPRQVKSATGNRGTYDPDNPDIGMKKGGLAAKPIWDKKRPKKLGKPKSLSAKKKKAAKARAKAAGRPYPNMVDNLAVARKKGK